MSKIMLLLAIFSVATSPMLIANEKGLASFKTYKSIKNKKTNACQFSIEEIGNDFDVYAAGAYSGIKTHFQIDQSGHQATQFDLIINSPGKDIALLLGAYEPSVWNIGWTQNTKIAAIYVSGYHRQVVAGVSSETPVIISDRSNKSPCGNLYISERHLNRLNPKSLQIFGKEISMVHYVHNGQQVIGNNIRAGQEVLTSSKTPPESFIEKDLPLAGQAGIEQAIKDGKIRPATSEDMNKWQQFSQSNKKSNTPPTSGFRKKPRYNVAPHKTYVILKEFVIPAGLNGGHSVTFILPSGVAYPKGQLGHSQILNYNSKNCHGLTCRS